MTSFLCLYRGHTISDAQIVALSVDPVLVGEFAARLLDAGGLALHGDDEEAAADPVLSQLHGGRRAALRVIVGDGQAPRERRSAEHDR